VGQHPFKLDASNGRLRVGAQFDAPITRLAERNTYRQSLIEYQQARRQYYQFEDSVGRALRAELRRVVTNQINFELQRLAVIESARQGRLNTSLGNTSARDRVQAIDDLLNAQNNFMDIWVNYEVLRYSLDLDLGTMQLDSEGLWIDPGSIGEDYGQFDPWLWKTEGCLPGEAKANEAPAGETLPGVEPSPAPAVGPRDPVQELPPPLLLPPAPDDRIEAFDRVPIER
jgi:hypothetical protein